MKPTSHPIEQSQNRMERKAFSSRGFEAMKLPISQRMFSIRIAGHMASKIQPTDHVPIEEVEENGGAGHPDVLRVSFGSKQER